MTTANHEAMHRDHRCWESEMSLWHETLRVWQQEVAKAQGEMKQLEKAFEDHAEELRKHAASLRMNEQTLAGHEHALAEYEKGGDYEELLPMAGEHTLEAARHAKRQKTHERLKQKQHAAIALWNSLLKTMNESAKAPSAPAQKSIFMP
jgi:DNA repair exonuclease SbcCD ATPase subunit